MTSPERQHPQSCNHHHGARHRHLHIRKKQPLQGMIGTTKYIRQQTEAVSSTPASSTSQQNSGPRSENSQSTTGHTSAQTTRSTSPRNSQQTATPSTDTSRAKKAPAPTNNPQSRELAAPFATNSYHTTTLPESASLSAGPTPGSRTPVNGFEPLDPKTGAMCVA